MDSPVRLQLKRNDYLRHKLFRKINRRRRAKRQLEIEAPVKELKKRLRLKRTFEDGKDGDISDQQYYSIMERVAKENNPIWNEDRKRNGQQLLSVDEDLLRILNDNSYDYRGYYNKYPNSRANADTHWTDEFKTVYHPTFSVYSRYSGNKSLYNPEGVLGGLWNGDQYIPAWGLRLSTYAGGKDGEDDSTIKTIASFLPFVGTAIDGYDVVANKQYDKIPLFLIGLGGDVLGFGAAAKAYKAYKAYKALTTARRLAPNSVSMPLLRNATDNLTKAERRAVAGVTADVISHSENIKDLTKHADGLDGNIVTNSRGESYRLDPNLPMYNDDGTLNAVIDNVNIYSPRGYREAYERRINNMLEHTENPQTGYAPGLKLTFPEFDLLTISDLAKPFVAKGLSKIMNQWRLAKSFKPISNFVPTLDSNLAGIKYAYSRNPELANIGNLEEYNNYIRTVFPESKVRDINYHMGPKGLQELKPSTGEVWNTNPDARGIYVTPDKSYAQKIRKFTTDRLEKPSIWTYLKRNLTPGGWDKANETFTDIYPVMVDAKNPLYTKGTWTWGIKDNKYRLLMDKYDAIVNSGPKWYQNINSMPETIVPKTEQTLILGSDADVAGFRRFMSNPQITAENASSITPEQWTAAQDAAIARGDVAEAQRLRDLHFKVSAPNTKIDIPLWTSSEEPFNSFDLRHFGQTDNGFFGYGHYMTPIEDYAASYHPVNRKFYVNVQNPYIGDNDAYFNRINYVKDRLARRKEGVLRDLNKGRVQGIGKRLGITENTSLEEANRILDRYVADETIKWNNKYVKYADEFKGKDGVLSWRDIQGIPNKREGIYKEVVVPRGEQIKSADAITYDDKGIRIPLGERDNFNLNDIRYGLLPLGIGLTGYSLSNYANGKDPEPKSPKDSAHPDMSWHNWWLQNRAGILGHNIKDTEIHPIWAIQNWTNVGFPGFEKIGRERAAEQVNNAKNYYEYIGDKNIPKDIMSYMRRGYPSSMSDNEVFLREMAASGVTYPQKNVIIYPTSTFASSAKTHERTHALEAGPQEGKIKQILEELYGPNERKQFDSYIEDPSEIYARLMDFREAYNLNPKKKITKQDLKLWNDKGYGNGFSRGENILNRYDDDTLLRLFNEVAVNNIINTHGINDSIDNYGFLSNGKDPGIHIKPENRGKFTRLKKRTGHSTAWFKAHGTPAQKKMAVFAMNSKRWHH